MFNKTWKSEACGMWQHFIAVCIIKIYYKNKNYLKNVIKNVFLYNTFVY
jgi:hypothetical protein